MWQRIGHGAVLEGADHPPPTIGSDVPGNPHVAHAGIDGEDGVVSRNFVEDASRVFWMNRHVVLDIVRVGIDHFLELARVRTQPGGQ